ncbi:MAG: SGNH/GDSL hydrolase family protein [Spirosomaceae bacterium]|nr:SGNH/GDSL hydrolase family protein [Spirosomataceae bacterium]
MLIFYILVALLVAIVVLYQYLKRKISHHRPTYFPTSHTTPHPDAAGRVVVTCAGDSITHGNVSANYVDMLRRWFGASYFFYNAGVNSDLSYTLWGRLDAVIATQPQYLTVLIGTNDVNGTVSKASLARYREFKKIKPEITPNFEDYQQNMTQIVRRLKQETQAKIALLSLPIMGENLQNEANQKADKYSDFIKQLAQNEGVDYLPLRERMKAFLEAHPKKLKYEYDATTKLLYFSIIRHELLGHSWDKITMSHGMDLTPDNLHFNTRGAAMIASLVEKWLKTDTQ